MSATQKCHICSRPTPTHGFYVVKIEVLADPAMPPLSTEELMEQDFAKGMTDLITELNQYSTDELQDMVHRRFEFRLCGRCQREFIANPLGLPRSSQLGTN